MKNLETNQNNENLEKISIVEEEVEININDINFKSRYYPRKRVSYKIINQYVESMKAGEKFPPIIVTKKDHIIIDGVHRYRAYKKLNHLKIKAIVRDISEEQIYTESIKLNRTHGINFTKEERDKQIWKLYQEYGYTFKEIGEVIGRHESTVSRRFKMLDKFRSLGTQEIKDKRKKVDIEKVIERLRQGKELQRDIAQDFNISESYVSVIAKKMRDEDKSPITIIGDCLKFYIFIYRSTAGQMLQDITLRFHPEGILISKYDYDRGIGLFSYLSPSAFYEYHCEEKFELILTDSWLSRFDYFKKKNETIIIKCIDDELQVFYDGSFSQSVKRVTTPPVAAFGRVDKSGVVEEKMFSIPIRRNDFTGLIKNTDDIRLTFTDNNLNIGGITKYEYRWQKDLIIDYEDEKISVDIDGDYLRKVISRSLKLNEDLKLVLTKNKEYLMVNHNTRNSWINYMFLCK